MVPSRNATPIPNAYWVNPPDFLAGEYPGSGDEGTALGRLNAFLRAGFDTYIDLTEEGELAPYHLLLRQLAEASRLSVEWKRFPVVDASVPARDEMAAILDSLDAALSAGRRVYLHCWGGVGRTGTVVGCYLVRHGIPGHQALKRLAEWWQDVPKRAMHPRSPETDEQAAYVAAWEQAG